MKKLLVTGISSFLGKVLAFYPQNEWKIIGLFNNNETKFQNVENLYCDITKANDLQRIFYDIKPDATIHLAALSNPNYCELHPEASFEVNISASALIARLCADFQIPLIFTSTDLVFDGQNAPYKESDTIKPLMYYGKHKAEAEKRMLAINEHSIIARLPVIFGNGGFMKNWIERIKEGGSVSAFTDEYRSMINAFTAIEGLFLLLNQKVKGIWHLGGRERISRFEFAIKMATAFHLPKEKIIPVLRKEVSMPAARPADVSMDSRKAYQIGFNPPLLGEALDGIDIQ